MTTQREKAKRFQALHAGDTCFILPNPWDVGSARILAAMGFEALATTSAGFAVSTGLPDYNVTRDQVIAHCRLLVDATDLPLTADLENGFGDAPEACANTIRMGADAGLVGGSIEDSTGDPNAPQYAIDHAADRIRAAVETAEAFEFPFLVTARAENFFTGIPDLADVIARLHAYQDAGAHVLYAPGLQTLDDIKTVLSEVDRPINVLLGPMSGFVPLAELAALGVKRVSMGSALSNSAYGALIHAARELQETGTLGFTSNAASSGELADLLRAGAPQT